MGREKYRRLTSLYSKGVEVEIEDDLVIWVEALNPFELEDAKSAAQAAKSRLVLSLEEHGSDEMTRFEGYISELGRDQLIDVLINARSGELLVQVSDEIDNDPDWNDRMAVLEREDDLKARTPEDSERKLLEQYSREYLEEMNTRLDYEGKRLKRDLEGYPDEDLRKEFRKFWVERRGGDRALEEFRLKEHFYAARICDGVKRPDGTFDHSTCDHSIRVWETEEEVRHLPDEVRDLLDEALQGLNMSPKEPSDSDSRESSSPPSASPSEEGEASKPSTRKATSGARRGSS